MSDLSFKNYLSFRGADLHHDHGVLEFAPPTATASLRSILSETRLQNAEVRFWTGDEDKDSDTGVTVEVHANDGRYLVRLWCAPEAHYDDHSHTDWMAMTTGPALKSECEHFQVTVWSTPYGNDTWAVDTAEVRLNFEDGSRLDLKACDFRLTKDDGIIKFTRMTPAGPLLKSAKVVVKTGDSNFGTYAQVYDLLHRNPVTILANGSPDQWSHNPDGTASVILTPASRESGDAWSKAELLPGWYARLGNSADGKDWAEITLEFDDGTTLSARGENLEEHDDTVLIMYFPDLRPAGQVTGLVAEGGRGSISLQWNPASDKPGLLYYRIERSRDGATGWREIATSWTTSLVDRTLPSATTCFYRVRAMNLIMVGPYSAPAKSTTYGSPYFAAGPSVSDVTRRSCTLSAAYGDPDGFPVGAKYRVLAAGEQPDWNGAPTFVSPVAVTGLDPGKGYVAYVQLSDGHGGEWASSVRFKAGQPNAKPVFTSPITVSQLGRTSFVLLAGYADPDNPGRTVDAKYQVVPSSGVIVFGGLGHSDGWSLDWSSAPTFTSPQAVAGLQPDTSYNVYIRLDDQDELGVMISPAIHVRTLPPNRPPSIVTGPRVSDIWDRGCTLSAAYLDPDYGQTVDARFLIVPRGAAPDWSSTTNPPRPFKTPQYVGGLSPNTDYDAWVHLDDHDGGTASAAVPFTTLKPFQDLFYDQFDLDAVGSLPTNWLQDGTGWAVQSGGLCQTAQALRSTAGPLASCVYRTFATCSRIYLYWSARTGATIANGKRHGTYYLGNGTTSQFRDLAAAVKLEDTNVYVIDGGTPRAVAPLQANTEYWFSLDFDTATNTYGLYVGTSAGGDDNGGARYAYSSTPISGVNLFYASDGAATPGAYIYLDEVAAAGNPL